MATWRKRWLGATSGVTAVVVVLTLGTPHASRVRAQDQNLIAEEEARNRAAESAAAEAPLADDRAQLEEGLPDEALDPAEAQRLADAAAAGIPSAPVPISLPTGEAKSAVTPQAISLPNAEGSIEGMGESFAPILSSGTATFTVPIALPAGRTGVQPSLALSYSSTAGNGDVGIGWSLAVPFISRQTDRGLPRYVDAQVWHAEEDRFLYNGGQELVPVSNSAAETVDCGVAPTGDPCASAPVPSAVVDASVPGGTWQQYRARVEGGFMRFFRSPDSRRWIVQSKDGTRFDFGVLPAGDGPTDVTSSSTAALQSEQSGGSGRVFRWLLTRMSDPHGSTVYYRYTESEGQRYLQDVHYLSPATCGNSDPDTARSCTAPLVDYGRRVRLVYESRSDRFSSYISGWKVRTALRLERIEITSASEVVSFTSSAVGGRTLVRRYHLAYQPDTYHSLLESVMVEGRPHSSMNPEMVDIGSSTVTESALLTADDALVGPTLPPLTFSYTDTPSGPIAGFGGIDGMVQTSAASPPHSADETRADLFDVNSDGLADLIVTDPARYRTAAGDPAVGVFFNGFSGAGVSPSTAGAFSTAVPMAIPSDFDGVMNLANANVVPMDIDGDGRSDLLHMPRVASYGYFAPTRLSDVLAPSASPAMQGWRWTRAAVNLPTGVDPRIDFGRDSSHLRVLDVNNDHLIDVVRTTGTVMQTWLNLGWVPAPSGASNDGKFGSASWTGTTWTTSTEPIESCLLHAGTPVDFADPEIQLADMNGDGLQDIVKIRRGYVAYWPGRGTGLWGEGDGATCARGEGDGREIVVSNPPAELNPELAGVFVEDVNNDGAADVVQVRFRDVDVWFNQAGESFTARVTATGTPAAPDFAPRVRFADIDGTGTTDIVFANADRWQWIDPMGGQKPRLLQVVDNGLGALTTITYASSVEDYLADLSYTGPERFTWSHAGDDGRPCPSQFDHEEPACYRSGGSPVISTVVRAVSTTDRFGVLGVPEVASQVSQTTFGYHDGYYEGIEQEFRGFGCADAQAVGDDYFPDAITRTCFHQGRRPADFESNRLADNPNEALKGREHRTEITDEIGIYLSTQHATYTVRRLVTGLDGRSVDYAFVSRSDQLVYDTSAPPGTPGTVSVPHVRREAVGPTGAVPTTATEETSQALQLRNQYYAQLVSTIDIVDNVGNLWKQTAHARQGVDPPIVGQAEPILRDPAGWMWRTAHAWTEGATPTPRLGEITNTYTERGDLGRSVQTAATTATFDFLADTAGAEGFTQPTSQNLIASSTFDVWGNATATCGGANIGISPPQSSAACLRYAEVQYDGPYAQLPVEERIAVDTAGSPFTMLATRATWDRGLGALLSAIDPNAATTAVGYDGFGRLTFVRPPAVTGCTQALPLTRIRYELTMNPATQPVSLVRSFMHPSCATAQQPTSCAASPAPIHTPETRAYVDGLGRARATLQEIDSGPIGSSWWLQTGAQIFSARGAAYRVSDPRYVYTAAPSYAQALRLTAEGADSFRVGSTIVNLDAFGRVIREYPPSAPGDATYPVPVVYSETIYGLLATLTSDPNDLNPSSPHHDTPAVTYFDGHGRVIEQVLYNRQPPPPSGGAGAEEFHRLLTTYRADGAVTSITRGRSLVFGGPLSPSVSRSFTYDTAGRRIAATDPDTDAPTGTAANRTWRYLFNGVGDLVAVRDPRQCGQNFYYDRAGRLLGEDYVQCAEAQPSGQLPDPIDAVPAGSVAMGSIGSAHDVDVRYFYDARPDWVFDDLDPGGADGIPRSSAERGRLTGISDRGQRSTLTYEARGTVTRTARVMAYIPTAPALGATANPDPITQPANTPAFPADAPTAGTRAYDENHVYVRSARYDNASRIIETVYPTDPDWATLGGPSPGPAPVVKGDLSYNKRGLPGQMRYRITYSGPPAAPADVTCRASPLELNYRPDGALHSWKLGDYFAANGTTPQAPTTIFHIYDVRRRLRQILTSRTVVSDPTQVSLNEINSFVYKVYGWDAANNLIYSYNLSPGSLYPAGHRPEFIDISHDALYRVTGARYRYHNGTALTRSDTAFDWRNEITTGSSDGLTPNNADGSTHTARDPMRERPAPMLPANPASRVKDLQWRYDWLGNMTRWDEDDPTTTPTEEPTTFYERGLGRVLNGNDLTATPALRQSALYLASNITTASHTYNPGVDRGGWLELTYGNGGNVTAMTVHARCADASPTNVCVDTTTVTNEATRRANYRARCVCLAEQHYQYRWDELNRLHEARRYDRSTGTGAWTLAARHRYRYDAANERAIKHVHADAAMSSEPGRNLDRTTLYVYPGDFERRGLVRVPGIRYDASTTTGTETQYLVAGNRIVWQEPTDVDPLNRTRRVTHAVTDLLGSTSAVLDIESTQLLSLGTFYPNGAQEQLWMQHSVSLAPEPLGFTGKEEDDEVGLTYFGHRYLIARASRWASADPLAIHARAGGDVLNSYHYVAGSLLQARDYLGLDDNEVARAELQRIAIPVRGTNRAEGTYWVAEGTGATYKPGQEATFLQSAAGRPIFVARSDGLTAAEAYGTAIGQQIAPTIANAAADLGAPTGSPGGERDAINEALGMPAGHGQIDGLTAAVGALNMELPEPGSTGQGVPGGMGSHAATPATTAGYNATGIAAVVGGSLARLTRLFRLLREIQDGFNDLARLRQVVNAPAAGAADDTYTFARLQIGDDVTYGMPGAFERTFPPRSVNPITEVHAEADAVQDAINRGWGGRGGRATMWVDRPPCGACGRSNGIGSLARELGVDEIIVHHPGGTERFTPPL